MLLLIDTYSILYRLFFALPELTHNGIQINAIYGLVKLLIKISKDYKPNYLCFCIDKGKPLRKKVFEDYKIKRQQASDKFKQQLPIFYKLTNALNFKVYGVEGFEADDVIFSITKTLSDKVKIFVLTGDKDLLQVINLNVNVILMRKGITDVEVFDEKYFRQQYEFSSKYYVYYKALVGDQSDNIVGVKGIGPKKARYLIKNLEEKKLDDYQEIKNELSKFLKLEDIQTFERNCNIILLKDCSIDISLDELKIQNNWYMKEEFINFLKEYNFASILKELNYSDVQMRLF